MINKEVTQTGFQKERYMDVKIYGLSLIFCFLIFIGITVASLSQACLPAFRDHVTFTFLGRILVF